MAKRTIAISEAASARLLHKAGAERVGDDAADRFAAVLEEIALNIAEHAVRIAEHSGRKTVEGGDVKLAARA